MNATVPEPAADGVAGERLGAVYGMFHSRADAENCFAALAQAGYAADEIDVIMSDRTHRRDFSKEFEGRAGSHAAEGAGLGGAIGGAVGASLAAIVSVAAATLLPGAGVVLAGPLAATLAGGGAGLVAGGVIGALSGLGVNERDAQRFDQALAQGGILLCVKSRRPEDAAKIKQRMIEFRAEDVAIG